MNEHREAVARLIDPSSWRVMDSYLAEFLRKHRDVNAGYDPDNFKHKESLAIADDILAYIAAHPLTHPETGAQGTGVESLPQAFCWLIEAPGANYLSTWSIGGATRFRWASDPNKALRFYSREQADSVAMAVRALDPDLWGFAGTLGEAWPREHGWLPASPPLSPPTSEGSRDYGEGSR